MKKLRLIVCLLLCLLMYCSVSSAASMGMTVGDTNTCSFNYNLPVGYSVTSYQAICSDESILSVIDCSCGGSGLGSVTVKALKEGTATVTVYVNAYYGKWDSVLGIWREDNQTRTTTFSYVVTSASSGGSSSGGTVSSATPTPPPATGGICGAYADWSLENGVLTITGSGDMFDFTDSSKLPWGTNNVSRVIVQEGITSIGNYAFADNGGLVSVTLPSTLKEIGDFAFYKADLTAIRMPAGITSIGKSAFAYNKNMQFALLPDKLTKMGPGVFMCTGLTSVTIPAGVTEIPVSAFEKTAITSAVIEGDLQSVAKFAFMGCNNLVNVEFKGDVDTIESHAFNGCDKLETVDIAGDVKEIKGAAFLDCPNLTNCTLPGTLTFIGDSAFQNTGLKQAVIPAGVKSIENSTFKGSALTSVIFEGDVDSIGSNAFEECTDLTSVVFKGDLQTLGEYAFKNCGMKSIDLPESVTSIGAGAFSGTKIEKIVIPKNVTVIAKAVFSNSALSQITFMGDVTAIENSAFSSCTELKSIKLPDTLTTIDAYVFYKSGLTAITIPKSVTSIGERAFYQSDLLKATVPENVTSLGEYAFSECWNLEELTIESLIDVPAYLCIRSTKLKTVNLAKGVKVIGRNAFQNCTALEKIDLPDSVKDINTEAFYCAGLTELVLPPSVRNINLRAFAGCKNLTRVVCNEGLSYIGQQAFMECAALTQLTLSGTISSIDTSAFKKCTSLKSVTFPVGIDSTGFSLFEGCTALKDIYIESGRYSQYPKNMYGSVGLPPDGCTLHYDTEGVLEEGFYFKRKGRYVYLAGDGPFTTKEPNYEWDWSEVDRYYFYSGVTDVSVDIDTNNLHLLIFLPKTVKKVWAGRLYDIHYQGTKEEFRTQVVNGGIQRDVVCYNCKCFDYDNVPEIPDYTTGDATGDMRVNKYDALRILQYEAGWNVTVDPVNSDYNKDGAIDIADSLGILQK